VVKLIQNINTEIINSGYFLWQGIKY